MSNKKTQRAMIILTDTDQGLRMETQYQPSIKGQATTGSPAVIMALTAVKFLQQAFATLKERAPQQPTEEKEKEGTEHGS